MFAIVETCGKQYRVETGQTITVDRIQAEVGSSVTLDKVLMIVDDGLQVGTPHLDATTVQAEVTGHHQGDKVTTFKYRRRHRTRRRVGYRHAHTTLKITSIGA